MSVSFLIYLLAGKVLIFFGMKFAEDNEIPIKFIRTLLSCPICWGFWVYGVLSFLLGEQLFWEIYYVPIVSELVTGGISSLIIHLISVGWKEQFTIIRIG